MRLADVVASKMPGSPKSSRAPGSAYLYTLCIYSTR